MRNTKSLFKYKENEPLENVTCDLRIILNIHMCSAEEMLQR